MESRFIKIEFEKWLLYSSSLKTNYKSFIKYMEGGQIMTMIYAVLKGNQKNKLGFLFSFFFSLITVLVGQCKDFFAAKHDPQPLKF